jgi:hypothetical protein
VQPIGPTSSGASSSRLHPALMAISGRRASRPSRYLRSRMGAMEMDVRRARSDIWPSYRQLTLLGDSDALPASGVNTRRSPSNVRRRIG